MGKNLGFRISLSEPWVTPVLASVVLVVAWWLRRFPTSRDPLLYGQLQFASGILALTFAAAAFVRFRATHDRLALILASGFVIVGVTLAAPSFAFFRSAGSDFNVVVKDPKTWVINRVLLGLLLLAALVVERRLPAARNPDRQIALAIVVVVLSAGMLTTVHWKLPVDFLIRPGTILPRPGNLLPASLFLLAEYQYRRRLVYNTFPSDFSLYFAAALNLASCLAASESEKVLDAAFILAGMLQFSGFAVLLGGALLDDIQLFEKVRQLSVSDPLTGLANYRQLIDTLEHEIQRSGRSGRPFAFLLLDLDGLKKINDSHGHLVGSRALCRVANVLRVYSRAVDTCARYGGDEFGVVLPETGPKEAHDAAVRICSRVAEDAEHPPISVSAGIALYPEDGEDIESLFNEADRDLYGLKKTKLFRRHVG